MRSRTLEACVRELLLHSLRNDRTLNRLGSEPGLVTAETGIATFADWLKLAFASNEGHGFTCRGAYEADPVGAGTARADDLALSDSCAGSSSLIECLGSLFGYDSSSRVAS